MATGIIKQAIVSITVTHRGSTIGTSFDAFLLPTTALVVSEVTIVGFKRVCHLPRDALEGAGVEYSHAEWLGGKGRAVVYDSEWNGTATKEGIREVRRLIEILQDGKITVLLCSEGDWRQCHREVLADIMVYTGSGIEIKHISPRGDKAFRHPVKADLSHIENPVDAPISLQSYRGMPPSKKFR
ncbi:hypothetical protein FOL47_009702 [Perkinsus chesapeaki]|uniref:DUF488 domain-containing protein n=1 Tax=Perkinsus chesapeaki TaxID=330153 RepID=A0A7J6L6V0_PERCH|nr:hypothetical protein FOL47_009702 [Perkinsus chesapeaki]